MDYHDYFDVIFADPPFLSRECIEKTAEIIKKLKKDSADVIVCSGQSVEKWMNKFLGLNQCNFSPEHENNLANIFCSYANFDLDFLIE